jgi:hypothetical protein
MVSGRIKIVMDKGIEEEFGLEIQQQFHQDLTHGLLEINL